eukprot:scaffold288844_cov35-Tisochrysis_lutea.AAC.4
MGGHHRLKTAKLRVMERVELNQLSIRRATLLDARCIRRTSTSQGMGSERPLDDEDQLLVVLAWADPYEGGHAHGPR